nr:glycerophosphodiester phosphodiesterase family protein [Morganella morganii]
MQNELANAQKTIATQQRTITTNNSVLNNSQLELIAHRGFARQFPQNSLFGFSCAIEAGATSLECDVQASTDGVLYVFHDLDVSALTNGTGLFREKSSTEIDQLRYKNVQGTPYADIRIPRFQDILFLCKERGVKIYAEFSDHMTDANILEYIRLVTYYDAESNVSTQCFNNNKLLFVRQHNKNLELGFLRPTAADYESLIPTLQANAPAMFLMEMNSFLSDSTIAKKCRNANVGLAVWTVQNGTDLARVMRAGCNRVVSDVSLITSKRG